MSVVSISFLFVISAGPLFYFISFHIKSNVSDVVGGQGGRGLVVSTMIAPLESKKKKMKRATFPTLANDVAHKILFLLRYCVCQEWDTHKAHNVKDEQENKMKKKMEESSQSGGGGSQSIGFSLSRPTTNERKFHFVVRLLSSHQLLNFSCARVVPL